MCILMYVYDVLMFLFKIIYEYIFILVKINDWIYKLIEKN